MFRILVVDDEPLVAESFRGLVPWDDYKCTVVAMFHSADEALRQIDQWMPDIVFTDIRMPGMDGLEFTKVLRSQWPQIPVILITGHADFKYAQRALLVGAFGYCLKPFDLSEILPLLQKACEQRAVVKTQPLLMGKILDQNIIPEVFRPTKNRPIHLVALASITPFEPPGEWEYFSLAMDRLVRVYLVQNISTRTLRIWLESISPSLVLGHASRESLMDSTKLETTYRDLKREAYRFFLGSGAPNGWKLLTQNLIREVQQGRWAQALELCTTFRMAPTTPEAEIGDVQSFLIAIHGLLDTFGSTSSPSFGEDDLVLNYGTWTQALLELEERIGILATTIAEVGEKSARDGRIKTAVAYLRMHSSRPIELQEVASACGLSEAYLSTLFKKEMGESLVTFLNRIRVEVAARLLIETSYSLEVVAEKSGFSNAFYFSRVFKSITGRAPTEYRRR